MTWQFHENFLTKLDFFTHDKSDNDFDQNKICQIEIRLPIFKMFLQMFQIGH